MHLLDGGEQLRDALFVTHVSGYGQGFTARCLYLFDHRLQWLYTAPGKDQAEAIFQQGEGDGAADAAACASDQCNFLMLAHVNTPGVSGRVSGLPGRAGAYAHVQFADAIDAGMQGVTRV
ncbi:hypothetical protein PPTS312_17370 [Pseudomonas putida]|uniref:Uncharacterized protein n=1 Tax=Pseudomonas putida TaxID=303 RepID=A0A7U6M0P2_PSEPU|nr:hypothetical protein PPTS312_17370 [Pseudomonas putida]